jgi:microcystin-dependent protein
MSAIRFVNRGEVNVLDRALAGDFTLRLFKTDVEAGLTATQLDGLDETDFTEATFTGYAAVVLTGGAWSSASSDPSRATYAQTTFSCSGGSSQQVYGYFLTDDNDSDSLAAYEQFDGPVTIANGDSLRITPQVTLDEGENVTPTGMIAAFGGTTAPTGWQLCDGSAISRSTNAALFAEIGTTFGVGNGTTTFNVPDLRQRFPLGKAAAGTGSTLGGTGGAIDHTHLLDSSTSHAKISLVSNAARILRKTVTAFTETVSFTATGGATASTSVSQTTAAALGGSSDTANAPFQAVNFIIKL